MPASPKHRPRNEQLLEDMTNYSLSNYICDMMQIMMERVMVEQPEEPLEFLINVVQNDPRIIALDEDSRLSRMDLRCVVTMKKYLRYVFDEMIQGISSTDDGHVVSSATLMEKIMSSDSLRHYFPQHYDVVIKNITETNDLPASITFDSFSSLLLPIVARTFAHNDDSFRYKIRF